MGITVLRGGPVLGADAPGASALRVRDGRVDWVGDAGEVAGRLADGVEVVDLDGATVAPAFVDAHVHATSTGLLVDGLDLTECRSLTTCLDAVAAHPGGGVVWGHGWDETRWPEARPPTRDELDRAARGRAVYLSRIDVHSAVVSSALLDRAPGAADADGWSPSGPLTRGAHHYARRAARDAIDPTQRRAAQRSFLGAAAAAGVAVVHECAGPDISGAADLADLLTADAGVEVVGYWGEVVADVAAARDLLASTGAVGLAGDLFCDGSIGSRTAALREPYADAGHTRGASYLDADAIAAHLVACTLVGVQGGFHVIGDAALDAVLDGLDLAAAVVGSDVLRAATHRLEHVEMIDADQAAALARHGVVASVQPAFDAAWGGPRGMYVERLGLTRAAPMNPFALFERAGVVCAYGSDSPVTPVDPSGTLAAATGHRTPGSAVTPGVALFAHTVGGYRAARHPDALAGTVHVGAPASYTVWDGTPGHPGARCLRTVHRDRVLHLVRG